MEKQKAADIETALMYMKAEIETLKDDISSIERKASEKVEIVREYNKVKEEAARKKKELKLKQKRYDIVMDVLTGIDESYLMTNYPLFAAQMMTEVANA